MSDISNIAKNVGQRKAERSSADVERDRIIQDGIAANSLLRENNPKHGTDALTLSERLECQAAYDRMARLEEDKEREKMAGMSFWQRRTYIAGKKATGGYEGGP